MLQTEKLKDVLYNDARLPAWVSITRRPPEEFEREAYFRAIAKPVHNGGELFEALRARFDREEVEVNIAVYLDASGNILGMTELARGTFESVSADPRQVFRIAIALGAYGVVIAHNHPTGDPKPSREDIGVTKRMAKAGQILGITLLDALVIAGDKYVSLFDQPELRQGRSFLDNLISIPLNATPVAVGTQPELKLENHGSFLILHAATRRARDELRKITRGYDTVWYGPGAIVIPPYYLEEFTLALADDGFTIPPA